LLQVDAVLHVVAAVLHVGAAVHRAVRELAKTLVLLDLLVLKYLHSTNKMYQMLY
jgi:hypothetical protein